MAALCLLGLRLGVFMTRDVRTVPLMPPLLDDAGCSTMTRPMLLDDAAAGCSAMLLSTMSMYSPCCSN